MYMLLIKQASSEQGFRLRLCITLPLLVGEFGEFYWISTQGIQSTLVTEVLHFERSGNFAIQALLLQLSPSQESITNVW